MKFYKSITFKLFILIFLILISFVSIVTYIQVYIVGRSYTIPEYTIARSEELKPLVANFATNLYTYRFYDDNNSGKIYQTMPTTNMKLNDISCFENANSVKLILFNDNFNSTLITSSTKELFNNYNLTYIKNKIKTWNLNHRNIYYEHGSLEYLPLFHIYNKYNIPTKYVAQAAIFSDYNGKKLYIATLIPDVFTTRSSGILKTYVTYIVLFLMALTIIVSLIASYFVARPVIKINKTASKIANLDFSEKCVVKNTDEIGNLAKTINMMSDNLQDAMTILKTANKKLNKDLDMQKELEKLRREFLGAVTHELKTPITLIRGYTESLIDNVAEGQEKELALKTIVEETEKMDKLVQDLLDLSKLESFGYNLNISEFYINELIDKICIKYKNIISERNIQLNNTVRQPILVKGDKFRIEQVLSNFISNAIDHTLPQKNITISSEIIASNIIISIHNEGKNIIESEINKIWEKFYRIDKSRNKKLGGTGLGLAISKSILDLHKSQYGVKNTDNGVIFFFSLKIILS